jgi:hypothetical protein
MRQKNMLVIRSLVTVLLGGLLWGCGPIMATQNIARADDAVAMAAAAYGDQYATYQYVSAVEYLEKAREEWGYSDFKQANLYAQRALEQAEMALRRVQNRLDAFGNPLPEGARPNSPTPAGGSTPSAPR